MAFAAFASSGITGWEADYTLKVLRRNSASRMSVQALYSGLANEFDNSTEMDDKVPMSAQTPTEFSLINGWHIPESSMDYLSGGSIQTIGYDAAVSTNADPVYVLTASAFAVNFQSTDIGKVITDGTRTGTLLSYNNTTKKLWVRRAATGTVVWAGTLSCTTALAGGGTAIGTFSSAATGEAAKLFIQSALGRHLTARAALEVEDALAELVDAPATDALAIAALQTRIKVASQAIAWLAEAMTEGENALRQLQDDV